MNQDIDRVKAGEAIPGKSSGKRTDRAGWQGEVCEEWIQHARAVGSDA